MNKVDYILQLKPNKPHFPYKAYKVGRQLSYNTGGGGAASATMRPNLPEWRGYIHYYTVYNVSNVSMCAERECGQALTEDLHTQNSASSIQLHHVNQDFKNIIHTNQIIVSLQYVSLGQQAKIMEICCVQWFVFINNVHHEMIPEQVPNKLSSATTQG